MIIKKIEIKEINLIYFVGINQLKINPQKFTFNHFFQIIENFQKKYDETVIQIFNNKYVLNTEHVLNACYYQQKAFLDKKNISNRKSIEFLLYLAAKRQIKIAIRDFGINNDQFKEGLINLCLISVNNNLQSINLEIENNLNANKAEFALNNYNLEKYEIVKNYFEISDNQVNTILNSYGIKINNKDVSEGDISNLYLALNDLICEKMTLLSLEKVTLD